MPTSVFVDGAAITIMGTCLLAAIKMLGKKRANEDGVPRICPVNTNGFKATVEGLRVDIRELTSAMRQVSTDVQIIKDREGRP